MKITFEFIKRYKIFVKVKIYIYFDIFKFQLYNSDILKKILYSDNMKLLLQK